MKKIFLLFICLLLANFLTAQNGKKKIPQKVKTKKSEQIQNIIIELKKNTGSSQDNLLNQLKNDFGIELIPVFEESDLKALSNRVPLCREAVDSLTRFFRVNRCTFDSNTLAILTSKFKDYFARVDVYNAGNVNNASGTCNANNSRYINDNYVIGMRLSHMAKGDSAYFSLIESGSYPSLNSCISSKLSQAEIHRPLRSRSSREKHADKTLGVFWANQSLAGCCGTRFGIVPDSKLRTFYSINDNLCHISPSDSNISVSRALMQTLLVSNPGDIVLLEYDIYGQVAESVPEIQELIHIATHCLGVTVIEPAGNGNKHISVTEDSGAIVVGAAYKAPSGYTIFPNTNYGKRIDVYSLTNFKSIVPEQDMCGRYSCTSAASAVIAAMAVSLQSQYFKKNRKYLTPYQMRDLFRKVTRNIVSNPSSRGPLSTPKYLADGILLSNEVNAFIP
ncbi:hypothetical protein [Runella aurantiaca]|uniref:Peptidase S8/S53 domain-containing protein n=1 Tax=Runella aurantiaca TaxID=2282308 RepID=A0A369I9T1_9BACT|nr:hypothetical protein [Runella aurantiaca]RDB03416.1 hypothetical protein DVG78_24030 [Runella aurantiaca]